MENTENKVNAQSNPTNMETKNNEGDLYCVPISYGESNTKHTTCNQESCAHITEKQIAPTSTRKKLSRLGLTINRNNKGDRVAVGKKRQSEHKKLDDGQGIKTSNKRLKGVASSTQPTSLMMVLVSQPCRLQ